MPRTKSLSLDRREATKKFVKKIVDERFGGNRSAAAKAFGVSQSMLHEVLEGTRGAGITVLESVADFARCSIDEVMGRKVPGVSGTLRAVRPDEAEDESPERAAAVAFARANDISEEAIRQVQAQAVRALTPEQWYARIRIASEEPQEVIAPDTSPPKTLRRDRR
jgi:hypothetical protein